jgi:epoxyqueuosine reductase
MSETTQGLVRDLRAEVARLGFQGMGICGPGASAHIDSYIQWIEEGNHGEMAYLGRPESVDRRRDLRKTMEDVRSVIVVCQDYYQPDSPGIPTDPARGVVSRYARGVDYHELVKDRLHELLSWLRREVRSRKLGGEVRGFPYVDTGPILERELGARAGVGWFGKNTMLLRPKRGSYFFLGILLTDLELPVDLPFLTEHCGTCQACIDACPTQALLGRDASGAPVMDARRCISYLTIELKGPIPRELRPAIGNRIFGCDICQEVCPWNQKFAELSPDTSYRGRPDTDGPALLELMGLTDDDFASRFSGSPIKRAKRRGFLRNVALALGNWGSRDAVPALTRALDDPEPLVRGHAAWALGRILDQVGIPGDGGFEVAEALLFRLHVEDDSWVEEELEEALRG